MQRQVLSRYWMIQLAEYWLTIRQPFPTSPTKSVVQLVLAWNSAPSSEEGRVSLFRGVGSFDLSCAFDPVDRNRQNKPGSKMELSRSSERLGHHRVGGRGHTVPSS